ncbi:MAG: ABC transporter ATP-binding protein [Cytophagales bacterium]
MIVKDLTYNNILFNLSFELFPSTITCILGENGSGKSTLIKCCSGYYKTNSVYIDNVNIQNFKASELKYLRTVFSQKNQIYQSISCKELIFIGLDFRNSEHFESLKVFFEIEDLLDKNFINCSGGEQQRILLVRTFLHALSYKNKKCNYILLDEPFNFLDMRFIPKLIQKIKELRQAGFTILVTVHDLTIAQKLGDSFMFIKKGKLIDYGNQNSFNIKNICDTFSIETEEELSYLNLKT